MARNPKAAIRAKLYEEGKYLCGRCDGIKSIDQFAKNSQAKFGLAYWCASCHRENAAIVRESMDKEKRDANWKVYYQANREYMLSRAKKYVADNPEKHKKAKALSRKKSRPVTNEQKRARRKSDPLYCLTERMRGRMRKLIRNVGIEKKQWKTKDLLGCTPEQLIAHFESLFTDGMSWEKMGEWHIDHKTPCAAFDLRDPEQAKAAFHYTNLQPLWAVDNMKKGARHDGMDYHGRPIALIQTS